MKTPKILRFLVMALMFTIALLVSTLDINSFANPYNIKLTFTVILSIVIVGQIALSKGFRSAGTLAAGACDIGEDVALTIDCDEDFESGVEPTFYICNKSDILTTALASGKKMLLTDIVMKTGAQFYPVGGIKQSTKPTWAMVKGLINKYKHTVKFTGFSISPDFMEEVPKFGKGTFVVIVSNNQKGADGSHQYDVYGLGTGLTGSVIQRDPFSKENGGGIDFDLSTDDESLESKPPVKLFKTNAATTATLIETLTTPAA